MDELLTNALIKGLSALSGAESHNDSSLMEQYALEVFARVGEIDNAFNNINITLEYLSKNTYSDSKYSFSEHHALHIENFLFRLTSIVDRSYLLAGSTVLMENSKIEKIGGNKHVGKVLKTISPSSLSILERMEDAINHLRVPRNKVAHQAGYSSDSLFMLKILENETIEPIRLKKITDIMSYDEIKGLVAENSLEQFQQVSVVLDGLVVELIDSFSFVYLRLLNNASE